MQQFDVTAHNYDFVFKDSFSLFKNDIGDFLKVELPGIDSYLETEFAEIETSAERMDLNFLNMLKSRVRKREKKKVELRVNRKRQD